MFDGKNFGEFFGAMFWFGMIGLAAIGISGSIGLILLIVWICRHVSFH